MSKDKKEFRIMLKIKSEPEAGITFTSFIVPADMDYPKGQLEKAIEEFMKTEEGSDIELDKKGKFKWSDALKKLSADFIAGYGFELVGPDVGTVMGLGRETAYIAE